MTAEPVLRPEPLAHRVADLAAASGDGVRLSVTPPLAMVNLRVRPESAEAARVVAALGTPLPAANTVVQGNGAEILWLGPDELLVTGPDGAAADLAATLTGALDGGRGSVVDVSAARAGVDVAGERARDVLAKGCSIDLHPRVLTAGRCAQTLLARATVLLWHRPDGTYRVQTGASFGDYLTDWLIDASAEYR